MHFEVFTHDTWLLPRFWPAQKNKLNKQVPGQPSRHLTADTRRWRGFTFALFSETIILLSFSLFFCTFSRKCQCHHPLPDPFSLCFITPGAPGCCSCRCVAMETETHFWWRWVFRQFIFWQLSVFRPSSAPFGCHWVMWAMTSSGVVVMNLPLLPTSADVCVSLCDSLSVLRCWAVTVRPFSWNREPLWEPWRSKTGDQLTHF